MARKRVVIHWGMSSFFGWGIYGLNMALNWSADPDIEPLCSYPLRDDQIAVDPLKKLTLKPFFEASRALHGQLEKFANGTVHTDVPLLAALGNDFQIQRAVHGVSLIGKPTIGTVFFEVPQLDAEVVARAAAMELIVTGSTWNEKILREYGVTRVKTVLQGIDPTLFHPAPRAGFMKDRFLVFGGGKMELRKGQDIAIAAFRRFAETHPDALLVTAWHSPWPDLARSLDQSKLAAPVPFTPEGKVDVPAWAVASGIRPHQILDLGAVPNAFMPPILREMDVALFPNRCEGGTNLVAMEAMACGVPAILSANSGHTDLIDGENCYPLTHQNAVAGMGAGVGNTAGWGESSMDEIVALLEKAYTDRADAKARGLRGAETLSHLTWAKTAENMKNIILSL